MLLFLPARHGEAQIRLRAITNENSNSRIALVRLTIPNLCAGLTPPVSKHQKPKTLGFCSHRIWCLLFGQKRLTILRDLLVVDAARFVNQVDNLIVLIK